MKSVHVKLSYETIDLVVTKEAWQYYLLEFEHVFDDKLISGGSPVNYLVELIVILNGEESTLRI